MKYVQLNTGTKIPQIGFGTWQILLNRRAKNAVIEALHAGYRLIDTAMIYGNEKGVGAGVRESAVARENIFVTTKLWKGDHGYHSAHNAFNASLKSLGLDYVDVYLIHWPGSEKRKDSWRALGEIYESGRAKAIGVSNYTISHLEELLASSKTVPAINQIEFHPLIYKQQKELLDYCKNKGIIVEAYSPLMRGRYLDNPAINQIARKHNKSNAQIILSWCVQHGTVPLPKSSHAERMHENIDIFDFNLSEHDMESINSLSDGTRTTWDPTNID